MYDIGHSVVRDHADLIVKDVESFSELIGMHAMLFNVVPSCTKFWINPDDYMEEKSITYVENYLTEEGFELLAKKESKVVENKDVPSQMVKRSNGIGVTHFQYFYIHKKREILVEHTITKAAVCCTYNCADQSAVEFADKFVFDFKKNCSKPKRKVCNIKYIVKSRYGFQMDSMEVKSLPKSYSIKHCYNDDFGPVHKNIKKFIAEDCSGLVILHGEQGTGKTTYLRHLIASCKRNFVYLPMDMAGLLSNPDLISFIKSDLKDSVIIIEDCEQLLQDRGDAPYALNTGLSNILNIADGLLGDSLCLKFICTFNNDVRKIDKALLRKGRLIDKYEFKKLSVDKTAALIKEKYGIEGNFGEMTLSDIYNFNVENHGDNQHHGTIGFSPSKK